MTARLLPFGDDPIKPAPPTPLTITLDGIPASGVAGQSLAGVILASGTLGFRRTSAQGPQNCRNTPKNKFARARLGRT